MLILGYNLVNFRWSYFFHMRGGRDIGESGNKSKKKRCKQVKCIWLYYLIIFLLEKNFNWVK